MWRVSGSRPWKAHNRLLWWRTVERLVECFIKVGSKLECPDPVHLCKLWDHFLTLFHHTAQLKSLITWEVTVKTPGWGIRETWVQIPVDKQCDLWGLIKYFWIYVLIYKIGIMTKSNLGGMGCGLQISPSEEAAKSRTQGRNLKEGAETETMADNAYWLSLLGLFSLLSYTTNDRLLRAGTAHRLSLPHQSFIKKMPYTLPYRQSDEDTFSTEVPLPRWL